MEVLGPLTWKLDTGYNIITLSMASPGGGHAGPGDAAVSQLLSDAGRVVLVSKVRPRVVVEGLDVARGPGEELNTHEESASVY